MGDGTGGPSGPDRTTDQRADREFGTDGWLLVTGVFLAFVVVPLVIYFRPPSLPFVVAYLVLPLVPAVLLALYAVRVTTGR